jgi:dephospho-CoA kinase
MGRERRESQGAHTVVAVGLTGGIGAGKSTALALLGECGALVFSADELVHRLYKQPGVVASVAAHFGPEVLDEDGAVDRSRLAEALREFPDGLRWLEELTHPLVTEEIRRRIGGAPEGSVVVCEVPLLFESGYETLFDLLVTVEADSEIRRRRSVHRFGLEQFAEFEARQVSSARRFKGSDLAFVNDGGPDELRAFVCRVYESARELLPATGGSDTAEYQTRVTRRGTIQPLPHRSRGYWVDPSGRGVSPNGPSGSRGKTSRAWRVVRMAALLVVLAGVAIAAGLILTGRTVVPVLSEKIFPIHYQEDIARVAEKYGQDPYLVAAVVKAESGYDPAAESQAGAVGLMQILPTTANWIVADLHMWQGGEDPVLTDPVDNLELGTCYLAYLGEMYGNRTQLSLAAYNAGQGHVDEWVEEAGGQASFGLSDIQYPETRAYVERVEHYYLLYKRIHRDVFAQAGASDEAAAFSGGWTLVLSRRSK